MLYLCSVFNLQYYNMTDEIVLYQPDDTIQLEVRLQDETVWLNQQQMAELFGTQRQAITKHLKNIFESGELDRPATCSILELVQKEENHWARPTITEQSIQPEYTELVLDLIKPEKSSPKSTGDTHNVVDHVVDKLTERQHVILAIIRQFVVDHVVDGVVEEGVEIPSASSMAKQLKTSSRTIQRELAYLREEGKIRRVDGDNGGHWEVIK